MVLPSAVVFALGQVVLLRSGIRLATSGIAFGSGIRLATSGIAFGSGIRLATSGIAFDSGICLTASGIASQWYSPYGKCYRFRQVVMCLRSKIFIAIYKRTENNGTTIKILCPYPAVSEV